MSTRAGMRRSETFVHDAQLVRHWWPYTATRDGKWAVYEAWKVLVGPNPGAMTFEWRWVRWWHPGDVWLWVRDWWQVRRAF